MEAIVLFSKGTSFYRIIGAFFYYGHCEVVVKRATGRWVFLSARAGRVYRSALGDDRAEDLFSFYKDMGRNPIFVRCDHIDYREKKDIKLTTCVSLVKKIFGIRKPNVILPIQLFWLLKRQT